MKTLFYMVWMTVNGHSGLYAQPTQQCELVRAVVEIPTKVHALTMCGTREQVDLSVKLADCGPATLNTQTRAETYACTFGPTE